ncbi:MAG: 50S ribosomal protein L9 [Deltaproteobacteria bacterium]|jgi:large subunit ribosomal protein L9|nr:50S ribosomal protein L9 [Deltaproteobacteria bacterium]
MEIILTKDVSNLGMAGQVLKVAPGYARNFLLPSGKALEATHSNLKALARKRAEFEARAKAAKDQALELKTKFSSLVLSLTRKCGDKGKLYGAVTPSDIVAAAEEQGFTVDRKRLRLAEPIKTLGDFEVSVRLHPEVSATFKVKVLPEIQKAKADSENPEEAQETPDGAPKAEEAPAPEAEAAPDDA